MRSETTSHKELQERDNNSECSEKLMMSYQLPLGVVSYTHLSRSDVRTFITALQRKNKKPLIIHCKRLNAMVKWLQSNPKALVYKKLSQSNTFHLRIYSDAAFKKEEETGHSTRGAIYSSVHH